jgi:KaiC/GvpD/RAD55 family RecA-like ATPase
MGLEDSANDLGDATSAAPETPRPGAGIEPGSAVLVRGPAMSGKFEFVLRALATLGDRSILVSTTNNAESARSRFAAFADPDHLGVVDCVTRAHDQHVEDSEFVRYASSPQNLTQVGVKFTDLVETVRESDPVSAEGGDAIAVGVHSLSTLLMYWEVEQVYQFVRVLLTQAQSMGWTVVVVLDDAATDEQTVNTLSQPFDAVVNTRTTDTGREFRLRTRQGGVGEWTDF